MQKWEALRGWGDEFKEARRRPPLLWIDKLSIEQNNIEADLQRLPIFLAGCNVLLVVSGLTYTTRLWCCVELFVEVAMRTEDDSCETPIFLPIGENENEHERVRGSWSNFDVKSCDCFDKNDKKRMLAAIARHPRGAIGFNSVVQHMATDLVSRSRASASRQRP